MFWLVILKIIFKKKKYLIAGLTATFIVETVSYYLMIMNVYQRSIFIYAEMNGLFFTLLSLFLGLTIAVLFGFYVALLIFKRELIKNRMVGNKIVGAGGVVTSIVTSGCPSCGTPLLGLFSFPLALFSLPFKGLEFKILSIIFLFLAIFLIFKNLKKILLCPLPQAKN